MALAEVAKNSFIRTRLFEDIDAQAAELKGFDQAYRQFSRGRFRGRFVTIDLAPCCGIYIERTSQTIESRGSVPLGETGIAFTIDGNEPSKLGGAPLDHDHILFLPQGSEIDIWMPAGTHICLLTAPAGLIGRSLAGERRDAALGAPGLLWAPGLPARLTKITRALARKAGSSNGDGEAMAAVIAETMISALLSAGKGKGLPGLAKAGERQAIFQAARDIIETDLARPAAIARMPATLNVSRRTLEYAFHETVGIGPRTYLAMCRLNAVRRELADTSEPIGDIAARYGIWHLSRFAGAYKTTFGELPSQTRSRHHD